MSTAPQAAAPTLPPAPPVPAPLGPGAPSASPAYFARWGCWLLVLAVVGAYASSLGGQFILDDVDHIVRNEDIRTLWPANWARRPRPVVEGTLALNYAVHGLDERGYHALNIAIHAAAAVAMFALARRLLERAGAGAERAAGLGWAIALLWALHPLHTQAVTYLIQRSESLAGLFTLLALLALLRAAQSERPARWFAAAGVAFLLGLGSKVVAITLPAMAWLIDRTVLGGDLTRAARRAWLPLLAAAVAAALVLLLSTDIVTTLLRNPSVGFGATVDGGALAYALTQPRVIAHYLGLSLFPRELCLDYAWIPAQGWREVAWAWGLLIPLALAAAWGVWRRRAWALSLAGFLVLLAPTSSFVPVSDLAAEHRMYLPLACVAACVVLAVDGVLSRCLTPAGPKPALGVALLLGVALALGGRTAMRNLDYHDPIAMWGHIARTRPLNMRAHATYGFMAATEGRLDEAQRHLALAAERGRGSLRDFARIGLGKVLLMRGQPRQALEELNAASALAHDPRRDQYLGDAHLALGEHDAALRHYRDAVGKAPGDVDLWFALGWALLEAGKPREAIEPLGRAVALNGQAAMLHAVQGHALARSGDLAGARGAFARSLALDPEHAQTQVFIGDMELGVGAVADAGRRARAVLAREPGFADAHELLGRCAEREGDVAGAARAYREALRLRPDHGPALAGLKRLGSAGVKP